MVGRPRKAAAVRMYKDLRIPVTTEQRQHVNEAAAALGQDMAAWAHPILLEAATAALAQVGKRKRRA